MHRAQTFLKTLSSKLAVVLVVVGIAAPAIAAPTPAPTPPVTPGGRSGKADTPGQPKPANGQPAGQPTGQPAEPRPDPQKANETLKLFRQGCLDAYGGRPALATLTGKLKDVEKLRADAETERTKAGLPPPEVPACNEALVKDLCTRTLTGQLDLPVTDESVRTCMTVDSGLTAGAAGVGADIVQSIAQVVVTKAQAAAWGLLVDKVREIAHCGKEDSKFKKSCDVLSSLSIKDLVSSPGVLLNAVATDLIGELTDGKTKDPVTNDILIGSAGILGVALLDGSARWEQAGAPGFVTAIRGMVLKQITEQATASCEQATDTVKKYTYVVGMCLAQGTFDSLPKCRAGDFIKRCTNDASVSDELSRLWDLTKVGLVNNAKPVDVLNLGFAIGNDELSAMPDTTDDQKAKKEKAKSYFSGTKDLVMGLVNKDWVEATSGGVRIVTTLQASVGPDPNTCNDGDADAKAADACKQAKADKDCDATKTDCTAAKAKTALRATLKDEVQLLGFLAPIGNYALTFDSKTNPDPAAAANAREKIIGELVDRMVNRTDRKSGAVLSLGGSLGFLGGTRFASTDKLRAEAAFPVQLELGVGLQTYHTATGGFHLMVSVLDLGQYVNMNGTGALTVDKPDLSAAVGFGLTVGGWGWLRETPWYIAAHASAAPFNQANGNPTFQAGVVTGVYVPLLDFN
jgi:hypothetical protein